MSASDHQCDQTKCPIHLFTKPGAVVWCEHWQRNMTVVDREVCSDGPYVVRDPPPSPERRHYFLELWTREKEGGPADAAPFRQLNREQQGLGDKVEAALKLVGITEERVSRWLGKLCNCPERREKLNQLGNWAARVVRGKLGKAKEFLEYLTDED